MGNKKQPVFFVSDSTAITVETLGRGILSQFPQISSEIQIHRFVDTLPVLETVCAAIAQAQGAGDQAVVFCSLVDPGMRTRLVKTGAVILDVFEPFSQALAAHWGVTPTPTRGRTHGPGALPDYTRRMQAVQFALTCDDGVLPAHYDKADMILLGVSRTGKTPTALYLAMQYSLFVANYPLSPEELQSGILPAGLRHYRPRLLGLSISPARLHEIRQERRANSPYAALAQCQSEIRQLEGLYRQEGILFLDVTTRSVEEVAGQILRLTGHSGLKPA